VCCLQDGTISFEIKLTGELSTNLLSEGEAHPTHGTLVGPGVTAQHHQHLFCARLDMAVDDAQGGKSLLVSEASCPHVCFKWLYSSGTA
jgi:primary-amine oxidase